MLHTAFGGVGRESQIMAQKPIKGYDATYLLGGVGGEYLEVHG